MQTSAVGRWLVRFRIAGDSRSSINFEEEVSVSSSSYYAVRAACSYVSIV